MAELSKKYNVIISSKATQMLVSHVAFAAQASETAAEQLVVSFEASTKSLELMPHRCPWLDGEFIPRSIYHKLIFSDRYLLIYQIQDNDVFVDFVVECRQDYEWLIH